jgi:hypothetical protein
VSLVPVRDAAPSSFDIVPAAVDLAERIYRTDFVPAGLRNSAPAVLAAILYGHELGLGPMESLAHIHVIEGRPAPSAQLMRAQVLRHGHRLWAEEQTSTRVTLCAQRAGDEVVHRTTFTLDDARKAGLAGRQNWQRYPRAMLTARATAELCRLAFPDVLGAVRYISEELDDGEIPPEGGDTAPQASPVPRRRRRPPARAVDVTADEAAGGAAEATTPEPAPRPPLPDEPLEQGEEPAKLTDAQRRKLLAACRDAGVDDRNDRLALATAMAGRDISSAADLTSDEASLLIDVLTAVGGGQATLTLDENDRPTGVSFPSEASESAQGELLADELKRTFEEQQNEP